MFFIHTQTFCYYCGKTDAPTTWCNRNTKLKKRITEKIIQDTCATEKKLLLQNMNRLTSVVKSQENIQFDTNLFLQHHVLHT